jgi:uncharacterized protein (DUF952 family)
MEIPMLYKIVSKREYEASQSEPNLRLPPIDTTFIHLAMQDQVERVLGKFWPDRDDALVLTVDPAKLNGRLVKEKNPGGSAEYWHLYDGFIPRAAVVGAEPAKEWVA